MQRTSQDPVVFWVKAISITFTLGAVVSLFTENSILGLVVACLVGMMFYGMRP